ncbi:hypothetical protein Dsin_004476 [Dipteronia sinensis]|uniref:Uncharacterized protein n=1 Tax=Dipteronia sinensis TaxID=43782 RepID=A0AAE0AW16_9ROSI|nr:hypothetical protein Dsin_004476 [Dipteronia sinensis]
MIIDKALLQRFRRVWVCGLCEEAIKEEQARLGDGIGVEVALRLHAAFRSETAIRIAPVSILQLIKKIMSSSSTTLLHFLKCLWHRFDNIPMAC